MKTHSITEIAKARLLPFSERTLRRMIAAGELRPMNIGRGKVARYAVTEAEIQRVLKRFAPKKTRR